MNHESISAEPASLACVDCALNDVLDEDYVREITSANFVWKGENLLLVGGPGTGKTMLAFAVYAEARRQGLSVNFLLPIPTFDPLQQEELVQCSYGFVDADERLVDTPFGDIASQPIELRRLRREYLDCDLLMVDDFSSWLAVAPMQFKCLLARRLELGRSTILILSSGEWCRLLKAPVDEKTYNYYHSQGRWGDVLLYMNNYHNGPLQRRLRRERTFAELLVTLSVGWIESAQSAEAVGPLGRARSGLHEGSVHGQQLRQALNLNAFSVRVGGGIISDYLSGGSLAVPVVWPFPVWHVLYTGENSHHTRCHKHG